MFYRYKLPATYTHLHYFSESFLIFLEIKMTSVKSARIDMYLVHKLEATNVISCSLKERDVLHYAQNISRRQLCNG